MTGWNPKVSMDKQSSETMQRTDGKENDMEGKAGIPCWELKRPRAAEAGGGQGARVALK
jgi:hypothetical protein